MTWAARPAALRSLATQAAALAREVDDAGSAVDRLAGHLSGPPSWAAGEAAADADRLLGTASSLLRAWSRDLLAAADALETADRAGAGDPLERDLQELVLAAGRALDPLAHLAAGWVEARAGAAAVRLPGIVAREVAAALPEGPGVARPAPVPAPVGGWQVGDAASLLTDVDALPPGTLVVLRAGGGTVVLLRGIHDVLGADPQSLYDATLALAGGDSADVRATRQALGSLCLPLGAPVQLVGHSQGGIVAMDLAADATFDRRYTVTHVLAAGSPVSGLHAADPRTRVLELDDQADLVPHLDLRDSRRGTGDHRVLATFDVDLGTVGLDHGLASSYVPYARTEAFATTPGVAAWERSSAGDTLGPVAATGFRLGDR